LSVKSVTHDSVLIRVCWIISPLFYYIKSINKSQANIFYIPNIKEATTSTVRRGV